MNQTQTLLARVYLALLALVFVGGWAAYVPLSAELRPKTTNDNAVPGYALLRVSPADAKVKVDGRLLKQGLQGVSLPVGKHTFTATAEGYTPITRTVSIHSDDAALVRLNLKPLPVQVRFESSPTGAQVRINGKVYGTTPLQLRLTPGWVRLKMSRKGYVTTEENVQIQARQKNFFRQRLGGALQIRSKDKMPQRWIPGGYFSRGSNTKDVRKAQQRCQKDSQRKKCPLLWFSFERPKRLIRLGSYWMDQFEVTRAQYQRCVDAKSCPPPLYARKNQKKPVTGVSWTAAKTYCEWVGGRLPTEAEWELAARGYKERAYPWGNLWKPTNANHGLFKFGSSLPDQSDGYRQEAPVGSFPKGHSLFHLQDMAGNVSEWVEDCFHGTFYVQSDEFNPVYRRKNCFSYVIRGGSWMSPSWELRTTHRLSMPGDSRATHVGFRCVQEPND